MSQGKYQNKRRKGRKNAYLFPVLLAVGGVLLIAAAALGLSRGSGRPANFTPEVTGAPSLKTDQETVDLGDVKLGQMVQVEYQLTNVGDKSLSFTQDPYIEVVEGCWPPVPAIGSMVLKPGESTTLSMEFMMHGDMGGMHDFRVHLLSNDPAKPERTLTVLSNWVE